MTSLPFINDNGCGLAIATRTYLDAINKDGVQPTDKLKGQIKAQEDPYTWFQFVPNLSKNLDNAFKLWDAVGLYSSPCLVNLLTFPRSSLAHKLQARNSKIRRHSPIQTSGYTLGADLEIHVPVCSEECTIDRVELQRAGSHCLICTRD